MNLTVNDLAILKALAALDQGQPNGVFPADALAKLSGLTQRDAQHSSAILSRAGLADGVFGGISMNQNGRQQLRLMDEQFEMEVGWETLQWIYKQTGGNTMQFVDVSPFAEERGISGARKAHLYRMMSMKGYLQFRTLSDQQCLVALSDKGRIEVERSMPKQQPASVVYQITNSPIGAFQPGTGNVAVVNQTIGADLTAVLELLDRSKAHLAALSADDRQEAEDQIEHIKEEVKGGNPAWKKIKSYMRVLVLLTATLPKFQDDMQKVCHNLKVEKQEIQKLFSPAKE